MKNFLMKLWKRLCLNLFSLNLNLEGQGEVTLSEVSYPSMYQNLTEGELLFFD